MLILSSNVRYTQKTTDLLGKVWIEKPGKSVYNL